MSNKIKTIDDCIDYFYNRVSLNEVADLLIEKYNKDGDDFPIVTLLNELGCLVYVSDFSSHDQSKNALSLVSSSKELTDLHKAKYTIAVKNDVNLTEQRFILAYSLGYLIISNLENKTVFINSLERDDCREFAMRLICPFITRR